MVLSKLVARTCLRISSRPGHILDRQKGLSLVARRWSGHNAMEITPTNFEWTFLKNVLHFWIVIATVPLSVFLAIVNIRANPELTEIPEGYEPRHWEYYKHPVARFMAKYFYSPVELDHEIKLAYFDRTSETLLQKKIHADVKKTMQFYNDHRSSNFIPVHGENFRLARDTVFNKFPYQKSIENTGLEDAYNPNVNDLVPVEGMHAGNLDSK